MIAVNHFEKYNCLHVMKAVESLYPNNILKETILIACQHILPALESMLIMLFKKGLLPHNVFIMGKCYSTSNVTLKNLQSFGINIFQESNEFNSHRSYHRDFEKNTKLFLKKIIKSVDLNKYKQIIILDDGGDLILEMNAMVGEFAKVFGVEQTARGYAKLKNYNLNYPIVNVAKSHTKSVHESPLVGEAIVKKLAVQLTQTGREPKSALIVGNGNIGKAVSEALPKHCKVTMFDMVRDKSDCDESDLVKLIESVDILFGCTGQNILPLLERIQALDKKIILASCSSSDIEFGYETLRLKAPETVNCHNALKIENMYLLNCGFPINFNGGNEDSIPLEKFQITKALLMAGILQGLKIMEKITGLVDLENNMQNLVLSSRNNVQTYHQVF
jgi:S-adenosylhomocysteine hydrolase